MTENFSYFSSEDCDKLLKPRNHETKLGECLNFVNSKAELEYQPAKYVILGIPEDIGIQGNLGKPGARHTWPAFLSAFLNVQDNRFNVRDQAIVLGHFNTEKWFRAAAPILDRGQDLSKNLDPIVREIDKEVSELIAAIIEMGKVPLIIGGGHNNAFGNLAGCSRSMGGPVNCVNIDAHTDLRKTDFRHSGNGFSFAIKEGYLKRYAMMGLHKNYTPEYIFELMDQDDVIYSEFLEDLIGKTATEKNEVFVKLMDAIGSACGLELDCDSIVDFPSSAQSPVGFSLEEIRLFLRSSKHYNPTYLHICEAAADKQGQVGKALSYLVTDFIRV